MHSRFFPSSVTIAQQLHSLATQLQPVLRRWRQVAGDSSLDLAERRGLLRQLERQAQRANRAEFLQLIERFCRSYCGRKKVGSHPCFDLELFVEEVKFLALSRLDEFEPAYPFHCWFTSYVLLPVYKNLGRSVVVTWDNRPPKTTQGRFVRWQAQQLLSARSMEGPAYSGIYDEEHPTMAEIVPDRKANPEDELLERHCRERFVQALQGLNEPEQALLTRICLKGELQKEVAQSVGLTPGRISQKLKQIYEKLARELGDHFKHDCGQTSFCQGWRGEAAVGTGQPPSAADPVGCEASLAQVIPHLVQRSGWGGVVPNFGLTADPEEQTLLEELFNQPVADQVFGHRSDVRWALAAAVVAAITVAAVWGSLGNRRDFQGQPQTIAGLDRSLPPKGSPPLSQSVPRPTAGRAAPSPGKVAIGTAPPSPVAPPARGSTASGALRDGAKRKTAPARPPQLFAAAPGRPRTLPPTSGQPPSPTLPEIITRELPDTVAGAQEARAYAGRLCESLNAAGSLADQPPGFALLEVVLAIRSGRVEWEEQSTRVIASGGPVLDALWQKALHRLSSEGLPPWPEGMNGSVHYYISLDIDQQQWTCQPVSE